VNENPIKICKNMETREEIIEAYHNQAVSIAHDIEDHFSYYIMDDGYEVKVKALNPEYCLMQIEDVKKSEIIPNTDIEISGNYNSDSNEYTVKVETQPSDDDHPVKKMVLMLLLKDYNLEFIEDKMLEVYDGYRTMAKYCY
jgi:hypothetical protein